MRNFLVRLITDESGVTAIEYGLICALISVVCIAGMTSVGGQLRAVYAAVTAAVTPALSAGGSRSAYF
jgi:pilus assembly protein Flp/PilA